VEENATGNPLEVGLPVAATCTKRNEILDFGFWIADSKPGASNPLLPNPQSKIPNPKSDDTE
jgi:hypothetical protein